MGEIEELVRKAKELKSKGFTTGEIADELNISRETALWLLTHGVEAEKAPRDIYIDWRNIGSNPNVMKNVAVALAELIKETTAEKPDVIAGIAISGIPLASLIAVELNAKLAVIRPKKHGWEPGKEGKSFLLSNFASVEGKKVVIVDDIATTGSTIKDAIELLRDANAKPIAAVVLIDKKGLEEIDGVPCRALISVSIVD